MPILSPTLYLHKIFLFFEVPLSQLNTYRAFRHVVIHHYGFELQSDRVGELVGQLATCHAMLASDLKAFCQFLLAIERSLRD